MNQKDDLNSLFMGVKVVFQLPTRISTVDGGDPSVPPKFSCENCGGEMYPDYYKGVNGYEYRIENVRPAKPDAERAENVTS